MNTNRYTIRLEKPEDHREVEDEASGAGFLNEPGLLSDDGCVIGEEPVYCKREPVCCKWQPVDAI